MKLSCNGYILYFLNKKDYSRQVLWDKAITKGYPENEVKDAIDNLVAKNFINDRRYAEQLVEFYSRTKGNHFISQKLKQKLVPKEIIDDLIEANQESDNNYEELIPFIKSKCRIKTIEDIDFKMYQKVYRLIATRGYSNPTRIIDALKEEIKNNNQLF
jgi:SOS response regulatory protein OraA/RecX